ncbi:O-methyltransferase [Metabacillus bambusae]|uniref:O-methyltransferase n=1 Tax=Metabacillus bambusae TaxID=2795218 RepID=UPI0035565C47
MGKLSELPRSFNSFSQSGALIVSDNVLQGGRVFDTSHVDLRSENMRAFYQRMANDSNLESIILPVGHGLSIGRVKESV